MNHGPADPAVAVDFNTHVVHWQASLACNGCVGADQLTLLFLVHLVHSLKQSVQTTITQCNTYDT